MCHRFQPIKPFLPRFTLSFFQYVKAQKMELIVLVKHFLVRIWKDSLILADLQRNDGSIPRLC